MKASNISKEGLEIITPPIELLEVPIGLENLTCTVEGCGRVVSNSSALRLHLLKSHAIGEAFEESTKKKLYACPMKGCPRNVSSPRQKFFKVMYLLKRHYLLIHAEKKHACEKCGKKFGTVANATKHEESCRKFFYCTCGVYYTAKNSLRIHLLKHKDHKAAVDPAEEKEQEKQKLLEREEQRQMVTVPCFLYVPKANTNTNTKTLIEPTVEIPNIQNSPSPSWDSRYIRILPKSQEKEKAIDPIQTTNYCNSLNAGGLFQCLPSLSDLETPQQEEITTIEVAQLETVLPQQHINIETKLEVITTPPAATKPENIPLTKFEKRMNFVNSDKTQEMLSNEALMKCTIMNHEEKRTACPRPKAGKVCRHYLPKAPTKKKMAKLALSLSNNCTQTLNPSLPTIDQVNTGIQTCNTFDYSTVEVLETSDFSSQCQFAPPPQPQSHLMLAGELPITDNQTQTDDLNSWFASLQNNHTLTNMETQTNFFPVDGDDSMSSGLDKSVQLDDILSGRTWDTESSIYLRNTTNAEHRMDIPALFMSSGSMECKQTTSTQTCTDTDDIQFEIDRCSNRISDKDIILPSDNSNLEPFSMSFGTQTVFTEDANLDCSSAQETLSFGTQTVFESNFFSSSGTQTWVESDETSINAKTIETQTAISFADLLDSSFIDEYLNTDRVTSSETQTQQDTYQNDNKELVTIETQTGV